MKVRTVGAVVNGASIGSILDLPQKDAESLIKRGYAEKVEAEKGESAPKKAPAPKRKKKEEPEVKPEEETKAE